MLSPFRSCSSSNGFDRGNYEQVMVVKLLSHSVEGLQEGDKVRSVLFLLQTSESHLVSRHELLWVSDVLVKNLLGPCHSSILVSLRVSESRNGSRSTSDNSEQVWSYSVCSSLLYFYKMNFTIYNIRFLLQTELHTSAKVWHCPARVSASFFPFLRSPPLNGIVF